MCSLFGLTMPEKWRRQCIYQSHIELNGCCESRQRARRMLKTNESVSLGCDDTEHAELMVEFKRRFHACWKCSKIKNNSIELYDRPSASRQINLRIFKTEVLRMMMHRCATWPFNTDHYDKQTAHPALSLSVILHRLSP